MPRHSRLKRWPGGPTEQDRPGAKESASWQGLTPVEEEDPAPLLLRLLELPIYQSIPFLLYFDDALSLLTLQLSTPGPHPQPTQEQASLWPAPEGEGSAAISPDPRPIGAPGLGLQAD